MPLRFFGAVTPTRTCPSLRLIFNFTTVKPTNPHLPIFQPKANWTNNNTGEEHTVQVGTAPYKKLRQSYDNPTTAQQACQDDLIKSQRQGSSVTLDALIY
ncbi:hypothetical protein [Marinomonas sp.]|uniref:hypothetical protein n=1 Tax=Marinomonas sp. TaxID=1904862 RepID=UPI003BABBFBF